MTVFISQQLVLNLTADEANAPIIGYHNLVPNSAIGATTESALYPATNMKNEATHLKWCGTVTGGTELIQIPIVDNAIPIDYVAIAGHNLGSIGATITIQTELGATITTHFNNVIPATDDRPLLFRIPAGLYTRFYIAVSGGTAPPCIAVMYIGKLLVMERKIYVGHTPINYGRSTNIVTGVSNSGNFLGRVVLQEKRMSSAAFQNITPAFYRANIEPFLEQAMEFPFFFAWRPLSYPNEVGYCWLTSDSRPSNSLPNGMMQLSLEYEGIAR